MNQFLKICLLVFVLISCNKKNPNPTVNSNPVPSVPVQITLFPNNVSNFKIQPIGGWMYIAGGIRGIIVYRKSEEEFVAIERTSSHLPNDNAATVQVLNNNFTLIDTISDSQWRIFDGTVTKGPAQWPLRLYGTTYDGNVLRIVN